MARHEVQLTIANEPRMEAAVRLDPGARSNKRDDVIAAFVDLGLVIVVGGLEKVASGVVIDTVVAHLQAWRGEPWGAGRAWDDHPLVTALHLAHLRLTESSPAPARGRDSARSLAVVRVGDGVLIARVGAGCVRRSRAGRLETIGGDSPFLHYDYRCALSEEALRHGGDLPSRVGQYAFQVSARYEPLMTGDLLVIGSGSMAARVGGALIEETLASGQGLAAMADRLLGVSSGGTERVALALALARWELADAPPLEAGTAGPTDAGAARPGRRMQAAVRAGRAAGPRDRASAEPAIGLVLFADGDGSKPLVDGPAQRLMSSDGSYYVPEVNLASLLVDTVVSLMDEILPEAPDAASSLLAVGVRVASRRARQLHHRVYQSPRLCPTVAAVMPVGDGVLVACVGDGCVRRFRGGRLERLVDGTQVAGPPASGERGAYEGVIRRALGRQEQGEWGVRFEPLSAGDLFLVGSSGLSGRLDEETIAEVLGSRETLAAKGDWLRLEGDERGAGSFVLASWEGEGSGDVDGLHTAAAMPPMEAATRLDVGNSRDRQEDAVFTDEALGLCFVVDGMGGQGTGEIAAADLLASLPAFLGAWHGVSRDATRPWSAHPLVSAIRLANLDLLDANNLRSCSNGGTVATVQRVGDGVLIAWVGDSRVYRFRGGRLELLTRDHTLINDLIRMHMAHVDMGTIPPNIVTRALGMRATVEVDTRYEPLAVGDLFLVCTDGLHGAIDDATIEAIVGREATLDAAAGALLAEALAGEASDNIGLVLVRWG